MSRSPSPVATFAILPMKAPGTGKTRLEESLGQSQRKALASAMYSDVLTALGRCTTLAGVVVVTGDIDSARTAGLYGAEWVDEADSEGHSAAALAGINHALTNGADRVLLVPGDCPLLDPKEVDSLLDETHSTECLSVIPDRHGTGTNGLLICPPLAVAPSFGPGSHQRHHDLAAAAGIKSLTTPLASFALDIDTMDDLQAMQTHLDSCRGGASHTRGLLSQINGLTNV